MTSQSSAVAELNNRCGEEEQDKLGETALKSFSEKRTEEERLNLIDEMLAKLTNEEVGCLVRVSVTVLKPV